MSAFDPEVFMSTNTEGAIDTTIIPVPEDEYLGQVLKLTYRTNADGQTIMDVHWEILDEEVKKITRMDVPVCRQGIWLDLTEAGLLDPTPGKNRQLGLVRDAFGQNTSKAWNPNMMLGQTATVRVSHSPNANDPLSPYANVKFVTNTAKAKAKKAA